MPRSCVWSERVERAGRDPGGRRGRQHPPPKSGRGLSSRWFLLIGAVIVFNIVALILVPPFPKDGAPGDACAFPVCFIEGTLEFPAPHVVWTSTGSTPPPADELITFHPSISTTILTMWIVMAVVLIVSILMVRGGEAHPGPGPEPVRVVLRVPERLRPRDRRADGASRTSRSSPRSSCSSCSATGAGWSRRSASVEFLRAPTSDVNITIGLALVSFLIFHVEGFRRLGVRGYLGKFFPLYEFKNGIGAGLIAMFVGLIELMLEFVKPVTLSMRLFGNIYGGEVALGVITALTIAFIPVGLLGLEVMLNAIQALIFSVLTLMFIVLAIESHHDEEGHVAEEAIERSTGRSRRSLQPAH